MQMQHEQKSSTAANLNETYRPVFPHKALPSTMATVTRQVLAGSNKMIFLQHEYFGRRQRVNVFSDVKYCMYLVMVRVCFSTQYHDFIFHCFPDTH